jgi:hypothetical protein
VTAGRGTGIASRLLAHVLHDARLRALEPFGSYLDDPDSTFMAMTLE